MIIWLKMKNMILPFNDKEAQGLSFSLFFAVSSFLIFWPGFFSNDSFDQIGQAISGNFTTWHPPLTAWLMRQLYGFCGAGGLLLFIQLLYWVGLWKFLTLIKRRKLICLILIGFFPPIYTLSLHVWKDALLMVFFLWAVNSFLCYCKSKNKVCLVSYFIFSILCIFTRINAFIPIFFLNFTGVYFLYRDSRYKIIKSFTVTTIVVLFSIILSTTFNKLIGAKQDNPLPSLLLWDIAGTANQAKIKIPLPSYAKLKNQDTNFDWQEKYIPTYCSICWNGVNCNFPPSYNKDLIKEWTGIITKYPNAYLKHRGELASYMYGLRPFGQYYPYHTYKQALDNAPEFFPSYIGLKSEKLLHKIDEIMIKLHLYQYPVYFILGLFILISSIKKMKEKQDIYLVPLSLSLVGLANSSSLFFLSVAADYRYMAFSVFSTLLSAFCFFGINGKKCKTEG